MDQFVTTYRRDYLWPYLKSIGSRRIEYEGQGDTGVKKCECPCFHPRNKDLIRSDGEEYDWSRIGPMGALLDPKLYAVKVGKSPESNIMRSEQPNRFLVKLQDKYPFLYDIIKSTPPGDLVARVNKDRYLTTYQVDYCSLESLPHYLSRADGVNGPSPCPEPSRLLGDTHRQIQRPPRAHRSNAITKLASTQESSRGSKGGGGKGGGSKTCGDGGVGVWVFSKSEYQDGISRLGGIIVRDKLHYHSSRRNKV